MSRVYKSVSDKLVAWYRSHARNLPWRDTTDPYRIWISEIVLQQTTVAQGLEYYKRFIRLFPDVQALAHADIDDVLKAWQGLGYYSRARNLHKAAQQVLRDHGGQFPTTHSDIITLPGIGPYTAAAISSFAFNENKPVVDGNVMRFITRLFGIDDIVEKSSTQKLIYDHAQKFIDKQTPSEWNQVIMEHGAITCTYKNPSCATCGVKRSCSALKTNNVSLIPVKKKKKSKINRYFYYYVVVDKNGDTLIQKRKEKDVWAGLYEFPLIEKESINEGKPDLKWLNLNHNKCQILPSKIFKQTLSHQIIHAQFFYIKYNHTLSTKNKKDYLLVKYDTLNQYPVPRIVDLYLNDLSITLF